MKKFILFVPFLFLFFFSNGQATIVPEVVSSSGGDASTAKLNLSWTVGEPVITTYYKPFRAALTQGFHQGNIRILNTHSDNQSLTDDPNGENEKTKMPSTGINVFPNPVNDFITVALETDQAIGFSYYIYDMSGKELIQHKMEMPVERADLTSLSKGSYILVIKQADVPVKQFRIIKD